MGPSRPAMFCVDQTIHAVSAGISRAVETCFAFGVWDRCSLALLAPLLLMRV